MLDKATGEEHMADVLTEHGLVLEFQHSHIDPQDETLELTNWSPKIRLNRIVMENRVEPVQFRLIMLREIHAFTRSNWLE